MTVLSVYVLYIEVDVFKREREVLHDKDTYFFLELSMSRNSMLVSVGNDLYTLDI